MRIIAGEARGRRLQSPPGMDTRPTRDRVKEALFGAIQMRFPCEAVLDLFAGSGAMGLEGLSRGAKRAVFIDSSRVCDALIREHLALFGWSSRAQVLCSDVLRALERLEGRFDVITADPPYASGLGMSAVRAVFARSLLAPSGILVLEHEPKEVIEPDESYQVLWQRKYGASMLSAFTYPDTDCLKSTRIT